MWTREEIKEQLRSAQQFKRQLQALKRCDESQGGRASAQLLASAIERVRWELEVVQRWQRDPGFYIDQCLLPLYEAMLAKRWTDALGIQQVISGLDASRIIFRAARDNLRGTCVRSFAEIAIEELAEIESQLALVSKAFDEAVSISSRNALQQAIATVSQEATEFREWLKREYAHTVEFTPVGSKEFRRYLQQVSCVKDDLREIVASSAKEAERAAAREIVERLRYRIGPSPVWKPSFKTADAQCVEEALQEENLRVFCEERGILRVASNVPRYLNETMPPAVAALRWLGVPDDLTSERRRYDNGVRYVPEPRADLPFFALADAFDTRLGLIHEGVHFRQLKMSWTNPDELRRHYYDSCSIEGIAFYFEELMLNAGWFDDAPLSKVMIHRFMRLRALRVIVDVGLACGRMTIEEAGAYLAHAVPMDEATAASEAAFFAATPGQGMSYQVGKWQVNRLVQEFYSTRTAMDMYDLHEVLWSNGNIPIGLLAEEVSDQAMVVLP